MTDLKDILEKAFKVFAREIQEGKWKFVREREVVSFFAFGVLLKEVKPDTFLYSPNQITIEYPVPKPDASIKAGGKNFDLKDLIIWKEPGMTGRNESGSAKQVPSAIIEWKVNKFTGEAYQKDIDYLKKFTSQYTECLGYSISIKTDPRFIFTCRRFVRGIEESNSAGVIK